MEGPQEPPDTETKFSSPWIARGTETAYEVKRRKTVKKSQAKRAHTLAAHSAAREVAHEEELQCVLQANADADLEAERLAEAAKVRCFERVLDTLAREGHTWGDFVEWISRPSSRRQAVRWDGLFRARSQAARILDMWAWKSSPASRRQVHNWAVEYVGRIVSKEGDAVTKSKLLQSRSVAITDSFLVSFDLASIHDRIRSLCPSMTAIMRNFSTTSRQQKTETKVPASARERRAQDARRERKDTVARSPIYQ